MVPVIAFTVREAIKTLQNNERTLIICTHNLKEAEELADQIAIIKSGRIILNGGLDEVRRKLIGLPEYEIIFSDVGSPIQSPVLPDCEITEITNNRVRFITPEPARVNPLMIKNLIQNGLSIITVSEVQHSLEDIYLHTVSQEELE